MRVASAAIKTLGQRNQSLVRGYGLGRIGHDGASKRVLDANGGRSGEDIALSRAAIAKKSVVGRVLDQNPAEISLGSKSTGGNAAFYRGVAPARTFQIVIAPVAYVQKIGRSNAGWLGEQGNEIVSDLNIAGLDAAITEAVSESCEFAILRFFQHLQKLQSSFQTLRCEGRDIHRFVVKPRGGETKVLPVE